MAANGCNVWLLILGLVALPFGAPAEEPREPLRFLGNAAIPPIISLHDGRPEGVAVDLAEALAEKAGLSITIEAMNWADAQKQVESGQADALLQINPLSERQKIFDFSDDLLESKFQIFRRGDRLDIHDLASLNGRKVGVEPSGFPAEYLKYFPKIGLVAISDWQASFAMIRDGRLDAVVVDRWVGEYELYQHKFGDIIGIDPPILTISSKIAVRKGNQDLLDRINFGIRQIKYDGTQNNIIRKWQGKEVIYFTREDIAHYIFYFISVLLFSFLILMIWSRLQIHRQKAAKREHALRTQAESLKVQLETMVEHLPIGAALLDLEGRVVLSNQNYLRYLPSGLAPSVDPDAKRRWVVEGPDGQPLPTSQYPAQRAMRNELAKDVECRYRFPEGRENWVRVSAVPVRRPDGGVAAVVSSIQDIDEQKRAADRQRLLLEELNHRVKNTLAIVQSIAMQTLRVCPNPTEFAESFEGRLQALAQAHNLLTQTRWQGATLQEVVDLTLGPYPGNQVQAGGPSIHLASAVAVSLHLALHELATNAAKFGALSGGQGCVRLSWSLCDEPVPVVRIDWQESGGPPVVPPPRRGFGTRLLEQGLAYDLDANVTLIFNPEGLHCLITFPLSARVAAG